MMMEQPHPIRTTKTTTKMVLPTLQLRYHHCHHGIYYSIPVTIMILVSILVGSEILMPGVHAQQQQQQNQNPIIKFFQMHQQQHRNQQQQHNNNNNQHGPMEHREQQQPPNNEKVDTACSGLYETIQRLEMDLYHVQQTYNDLLVQYHTQLSIYNETQRLYDTSIYEYQQQVQVLNNISLRQDYIIQEQNQLLLLNISSSIYDISNIQVQIQQQQDNYTMLLHQYESTVVQLQQSYEQQHTIQQQYMELQQQQQQNDRHTRMYDTGNNDTTNDTTDAIMQQQELQQQIQVLNHEISEWKEKYNTVQLDMKEHMNQIQNNYEYDIQNKQNEFMKCSGSLQQLQQQYQHLDTKYDAILHDYNVTLQQYLLDQLQIAVQDEIRPKLQKIQNEYEEYQRNCTKDIQHQIILHEENYTIHQEEIYTLQNQYDLYYNESQSHIQQIRNEMIELQQQYEYNISNVITMYNNTIQELHVSYQQQHNGTIQNMILSYDTKMNQIQEQMNHTSNELLTLQQLYSNQVVSYDQLQLLYEQQLLDTLYWVQQFDQRSYLNISYILHDMIHQCHEIYQTHVVTYYTTTIQPYMSYHLIQQHVQSFVYTLYDPYILSIQFFLQQRYKKYVLPHIHSIQTYYTNEIVPQYVNPCRTRYIQYIHPHVQQIYSMYDTYIHPHIIQCINTIFKPYYHIYIVPQIQMVQQNSRLLYKTMIQYIYDIIPQYCYIKYQSTIHMISSQYSTICTRTVDHVQYSIHHHHNAMIQDISNQYILPYIQYTCTNSDIFILRVLQFFLCSIILYNYRIILSFIYKSFYTILVYTVWYYNPIRIIVLLLLYVLFRRRRNRRNANDNDAINQHHRHDDPKNQRHDYSDNNSNHHHHDINDIYLDQNPINQQSQ